MPLELLELEVSEKIADVFELILYNDDVNTFDHVIQTLIEVCEHEPLQAEQCALLVHYKGQCVVKTGSPNELEPRCAALLHAGLSAEVKKA